MNHDRTYSRVSKLVNRLTPMSRRFRNGTIVAAGAVVLTSCASNAPQDTWVPKGPNAKIIDDLQKPVFAVAGIIGLIVTAAVVYAIYKLSLIHI